MIISPRSQTREEKNVFIGHTDTIVSMIMESHLLFTCSADKTIKSWNSKVIEDLIRINSAQFVHKTIQLVGGMFKNVRGA